MNSVREENGKLKSENEVNSISTRIAFTYIIMCHANNCQVLNKYIENLMSASDVFATTTSSVPKT